MPKYNPSPKINVQHAWASNTLTKPPLWCSVDLRDGNQALEVPMTLEKKLEFFHTLVKCGFKEIEIGFPAASQTEYAFTRKLIEDNLIPDDVTIQVLTQAREDIIFKTIEAVNGAKNVIIHLYNSTSPTQRRIVFKKSKAEVISMAVNAVKLIKNLNYNVTLEYSPESFSATEIDFSCQICHAVYNEWAKSMIFNLPATVEVSMPNVYADQIEYFHNYFVANNLRKNITISVHTHNDRGTGVAATELALLAGADRVEGTLFGNGERTGNVDIITLALNLKTQGIKSNLDFSNIPDLVDIYEYVTGMVVSPRHPYSGKLVFTAFSGSHQDAIKKGIEAIVDDAWDVPYIPIDPNDIGIGYENLIRVNGQSGKGGIAYLLKDLSLPKELLIEFSAFASVEIDKVGEVTSEWLFNLFKSRYIHKADFSKFVYTDNECTFLLDGGIFLGVGNGIISSFINALSSIKNIEVIELHEHSLTSGTNAEAISYVKISVDGRTLWGAAINSDSQLVGIEAILSAIN